MSPSNSIVKLHPERNTTSERSIVERSITSKYYLADSKGVIRSKDSSEKLKIYDRQPTLPKHPRSPPMELKRNANLEKLEDAIYSHVYQDNGMRTYPYRDEYMKVFDEMRGKIEADTDEYTLNLNTSRYKALGHCWNHLKWRPCDDGTKVHIIND